MLSKGKTAQLERLRSPSVISNLPPLAGQSIDSPTYADWYFSLKEGTIIKLSAYCYKGNVVLRKKRLMRTPEEVARYSKIRSQVGQYNSDRFKLAQEGYDSVVQWAWSSQIEPIKVFQVLAIPDQQSDRLDSGGRRGLCYIARQCPECHQLAIGDTNLKHSCTASGLDWHVTPIIWLPLPADILRLFPHVQPEVDAAVESGELLEFSSDSELSKSDYQRAGYSSRPTLPPIYIVANGTSSTLARKQFQRLQAIDNLYAHNPQPTAFDSKFLHIVDSGRKELYQALAGNGQSLYHVDCEREDCKHGPTMVARDPIKPKSFKHPATTTVGQHQAKVGAKVADFCHVPYSIQRRAICATFLERETMHGCVGGMLEQVLNYAAA